MTSLPYKYNQKFVRNIPKDLVLGFLSLGLWNIYLQSIQIQAVNEMIQREKYSFLKWLFFVLITFGLYHLYHEYKICSDIEKVHDRLYSNMPILHLLISIMGMSIVADALQQEEINKFFINKYKDRSSYYTGH